MNATVTIHEKPPTAAQSTDETAVVTDVKGRRIGVKRLSVVESYRMMKLTKATGEEGYFSFACMAASVRSIDGDPTVFPVTDPQIEAALQRLGEAGLAAVASALAVKEDATVGEDSAAPKL